MGQIISDINAMKYREVECNNCENTKSIDVESYYEDDYGDTITVYYCRKCENYFELEKDETTYEEGSYHEDKWKELDDDMKVMIGIK
ncbi:hypothetical protein WS9_008490 [Paraclostridium sordellii 8483]|uniref:hypothetical protein n=1 Tax=Paraclostridium sordellii TaxID=1505 RepID=UPI0002E9458B|nr:hypothetical protein [Paeniclostridium sordellii]TAN67430.1 hypothetical protein WS9_008490 [Paeniclostridium sordellii 8483]